MAPGIPILTQIETSMTALIKAMSICTGYNYEWDTVNEIDLAVGSFPRAVIDSPIELQLGVENNVDILNGANSQAYTNEVIFTIDVLGILAALPASENSYFAIRKELRKALDDLKMLFGRNPTVNNTCDTIMYRDSKIAYIQRNDVLRPAGLKTSWLCIYSQDRLNPSQYCSS